MRRFLVTKKQDPTINLWPAHLHTTPSVVFLQKPFAGLRRRQKTEDKIARASRPEGLSWLPALIPYSVTAGWDFGLGVAGATAAAV